MEIKTKFNIGQKVYGYRGTEITCSTVDGIDVDVDSDGDVNIRYGLEERSSEREDWLFKTRAQVKKYLLKQVEAQ